MTFDALILDMDGVLADTEPLHIRSWDLALEDLPGTDPRVAGGPTDRRIATRVEREKLTGMASAIIAAEMIRIFGLAVTVEVLLAKKRSIYRSLVEAGMPPFPGVPEELAAWKGRPLGLATSASRDEARFMLGLMGLAGVFDPVVTSDDVPRAKPAPDCYVRAFELLRARPERCVVIEDSLHGIRAALDAGAKVLAVTATALPETHAGVVQAFPTTVEALRWLRR
jgi:HAD superfamily hydrolase (TIGR01509 family)